MDVRKFLLVWSAVCLFSPAAHAHYPIIKCASKAQIITCDVGFSDGSKAIGKSVKLYNYDENLLEHKKADKFSRAVFTAPKGEFYIQFDSGHEFPVEVDYEEL